MHITRQNRQLVKIAGSINLLLLLLCIIFAVYMEYDHWLHGEVVKRAIKFAFANAACWIVNLSILILVSSRAFTWKSLRWLFFYLPSYLLTFVLSLIISHSSLYTFLSDDQRKHKRQQVARQIKE